MNPSAHIGNIPVEEWLPFLVPIIGLYIYGRRKDRRRRAAVARLPDVRDPLDGRMIEDVLADLSRANHDRVSADHLPLLYPPGPDGLSVLDLAERTNSDDPAVVERLLVELEGLEYLDLDGGENFEDQRAWLTFKGFELVDATEIALLAAAQLPAGGREHPGLV